MITFYVGKYVRASMGGGRERCMTVVTSLPVTDTERVMTLLLAVVAVRRHRGGKEKPMNVNGTHSNAVEKLCSDRRDKQW